MEIPATHKLSQQTGPHQPNTGWLYMDIRQVIKKTIMITIKKQVGKVLKRVAQFCIMCDPSPSKKGLTCFLQVASRTGALRAKASAGPSS